MPRMNVCGAALAALAVSGCNLLFTGPSEASCTPDFTGIDSVLIGLRPYGVAVTRDGDVLVTQLDGQSVTQLSICSVEVTGTVAVGLVPTGIAVNPAGTVALVTNQHDFTVGFVDVSSGTQTKVVNGTSNTFRAIFTSNGGRAFVTQAHGPVLVIDMAQQAIVGTIPTISLANGVALLGDTLLILSSTGGEIAYLDTRTLTEQRRFFVGKQLQDVVVSRSGAEFYVASEFPAGIEVRSVATGALTATIPVSSGTFGLAMTPDGGHLWAAHTSFFTSGSVSVIDLATRTVVRTIPVPAPRRIAFHGDGTAVVSDESGWVYFIR
jgi:YVTN family beta-propeller protein